MKMNFPFQYVAVRNWSFSVIPTYLSRIILIQKYCSNSSSKIPDYLYIESETGLFYTQIFKRDIRVLCNFLTEIEEQSLHDELEPILSRRRYEFNHWDDAIHGFREIDYSKWNVANHGVIDRARKVAFDTDVRIIPQVHVVDLDPKGWIKPHIDSVKFCGSIISGLSLLSDSIMRLTLESDENVQCDILLPRRSLYIMKNDIRYKFKHAILKDEESYFKGYQVPRGRRISLVSREDV